MRDELKLKKPHGGKQEEWDWYFYQMHLTLLKPFTDWVREQERERCIKIILSHKSWEGPHVNARELETRARIVEHCTAIAKLLQERPQDNSDA